MRRTLLIAAMIVVFSTAMPAWGAAPVGDTSKTGTLTVSVTGLKSDKGSVRIALFNSEVSYAGKDDEQFRKAELAIHDGTAIAVFEQLPPGEYAVRLFHDKNGNGKLDKLMGVPVEDYAFSNNARGVMGPPGFKKARFTFDGRESTIGISITPK